MNYPWRISCFYFLLFIFSGYCYNSYSQINTPSGFGGVGMQISIRDGQIYVVSVIPDSPAERMGIHSGDIITGVNGEPVNNLSLEKVVGKIRGPEGTGVNLAIKREGKDQELSFSVNRGFIVANIPPKSIST